MKTSLRAFDVDNIFLGAVTCSEESNRADRVEALKEAFTEEGFDLLVHNWAVDDKFKEDKNGEVTILGKEEAAEVSLLDPGERVFGFNKVIDPAKGQVEEYRVYESELTKEEIGVLVGDFIERWNFLPPAAQGNFMNYFLDSMEAKGVNPRSIGERRNEPERMMGVEVTQEWVKTPNAEGNEQFTSNGWFTKDGEPLPIGWEDYSGIVGTAVNQDMNPSQGMWTLPMSKYIELIKNKKSNESSSN